MKQTTIVFIMVLIGLTLIFSPWTSIIQPILGCVTVIWGVMVPSLHKMEKLPSQVEWK